MLSRGWIRTAGHYHSQEAKEAKAAVFPEGYDPTGMFWLVNSRGAFGARSGLPRLAKETAVGWFKGGKNADQFASVCEYTQEMSCYTPTNVVKRLATMLSHGASFTFAHS